MNRQTLPFNLEEGQPVVSKSTFLSWSCLNEAWAPWWISQLNDGVDDGNRCSSWSLSCRKKFLNLNKFVLIERSCQDLAHPQVSSSWRLRQREAITPWLLPRFWCYEKGDPSIDFGCSILLKQYVSCFKHLVEQSSKTHALLETVSLSKVVGE